MPLGLRSKKDVAKLCDVTMCKYFLEFVWQKLQYSNDRESLMFIFSGNRAGTFDVTLDIK